MKFEHEYRTEDKSAWGEGPWQSEPDKAQWTDEATGLPCLIVRNGAGALCGYVGVTAAHPWHGRGYDDVDPDVHGGLTFARECRPDGDQARNICHIQADGQHDAMWWFGFDCAHCDDLCPAYARLMLDPMAQMFADPNGDTYRDVTYVVAECAKLAQQIASAPA